jgi:hypothetical protein
MRAATWREDRPARTRSAHGSAQPPNLGAALEQVVWLVPNLCPTRALEETHDGSLLPTEVSLALSKLGECYSRNGRAQEEGKVSMLSRAPSKGLPCCMVSNLKTAKALGLTMLPGLLQRVD